MPVIETEAPTPEQVQPPDNTPLDRTFTFISQGKEDLWALGRKKLIRAQGMFCAKRGKPFKRGGQKTFIEPALGASQETLSHINCGTFNSTDFCYNPTPSFLLDYMFLLAAELNEIDGRPLDGPVAPDTLYLASLQAIYATHVKRVRSSRRAAGKPKGPKAARVPKKRGETTLVLSPEPGSDTLLGADLEPEVPTGHYLLPLDLLPESGQRLFLSNIHPLWEESLRGGKIPISVQISELKSSTLEEEQLDFALPTTALQDPKGPRAFTIGAGRTLHIIQGLKPLQDEDVVAILSGLREITRPKAVDLDALLVEPTPDPKPTEDPQEALLAPAPSVVARAEKRARKALAAPKDETQMENLEAEAATSSPLRQFQDLLTQARPLVYLIGPDRPDLDQLLGRFLDLNADIQKTH